MEASVTIKLSPAELTLLRRALSASISATTSMMRDGNLSAADRMEARKRNREYRVLLEQL